MQQRIFISSLIIVILTCQFVYAMQPDGSCEDKLKYVQEVTKGESEEINIEPNFDLSCCIGGSIAFINALLSIISPSRADVPNPIGQLIESIVTITFCCGAWDIGGGGDGDSGCTWGELYTCQLACNGNSDCERACWEYCSGW